MRCTDVLRKTVSLETMTVVEPSAGNGAFSNQFQGCVAVDIEPAAPNIIQADFLTLGREALNLPDPRTVVIVGNPPFGAGRRYGYREAHNFLAHSMTLADTVAFILPAAFSGPYQQASINKSFHLVQEVALPIDSFTPNVNISCVFQIWQRLPKLRDCPSEMIQLSKQQEEIFTSESNAQSAIVRAGYNSGIVKDMSNSPNRHSHFFLSLDLSELTGTFLVRPSTTRRHRYVTKAEIVYSLRLRNLI